MKERDLTPHGVNPTLEVGIKFMAENNGEQEKQPKAEKLADLGALPDKAKIAARDYLTQIGRRKLSFEENQTLRLMLSNPEEAKRAGAISDSDFTLKSIDGGSIFNLDVALTKNGAKEFVKILKGESLNSEQKELRTKIYNALENDPEGFADMFAKAIDSLSVEDVESFLKTGSFDVVNTFLSEINKRAKGKISSALLEKYKKEAQALSGLPPQEAREELKYLMEKIEARHNELEGQEVFKDFNKEEEEKIYNAIFEVEAKRGLPKKDNLSDEVLKKYKQRLTELSSLSKEERVKEARRIFNELDEEKTRLFGERYKGKAAEPDEIIEGENSERFERMSGSPDTRASQFLEQFEQQIDEMGTSEVDWDALEGEMGVILNSSSQYRAAKPQFLNSISQLRSLGDNEENRRAAKGFVKQLRAINDQIQNEPMPAGYNESEIPDNIEEVARFISKNVDSEIYGPNGIHPIIDDKGRFIPANFLLWVREWSVKLDQDNPNDQLSPLTAISLKTRWREISLYEMVRHNRERFMKDKNTGEVLNDLADEALYESWAYGIYRNTSLAYQQIMTSDTELPKALTQFHARSDLTRGDTLQRILSISAEFGKEGDTKVGDAIRMANDFYYHWSDKDKIIEVLNNGQFTVDDFKNAMRILNGKKEWDDADWNNVGSYRGFHFENNNVYYQQGDDVNTRKEMFDKNGNLDWKNFIFVMNFYKYNSEEQFSVNLSRELISGKIAEKYGLDRGIATSEKEIQDLKKTWEEARSMGEQKYRDLGQFSEDEIKEKAKHYADSKLMKRRHAKRINLEYAENTAFALQRGYGAAARNDTNRRGFDAATKLFLEDYLIRQSGENTAGPIGIPGEIPIFKMLGPDMWIGLRTESGLSPYQIYENIRKIENDPNKTPEEKQKERKEWIGKLNFRTRAENEYAGNQGTNSFEIFKSITDSNHLDLNEIVSYSLLEGVKYNPQKFEAMIKDGFIKPMRYAFSSNSGLDYGQTVRVFDYQTSRHKPEEVPIYKDKFLAQAMFGDMAFEGINFEIEKGGRSINLLKAMNSTNEQERKAASEYLSGTKVRSQMVKNLARTRIAAQLAFHRQFGGVGPRWDYDRAETFIKALESMKEYEINPDNPNEVRQKKGKAYFSKEDIAWIRRHSNTQLWKLVGEGVAAGTVMGLADATPKSLGIFISYILKQ